MTEPNTLGCEHCSGRNDKKGWIGNYSSDGFIGYSQCWNCNKSGKPSPDEPGSAVQPPNTDTLDEQIDAILHPIQVDGTYYTIVDKQQLKTLFTEHSKQARIDELEKLLPMFKPHVENRLAQLKRNKGEDNETN